MSHNLDPELDKIKEFQGFIYWGVQGGIFPPKSSIFPPPPKQFMKASFFFSFQSVHICHYPKVVQKYR